MNQLGLFDTVIAANPPQIPPKLSLARAARDEAQARVLDNEPPPWIDDALALLRRFVADRQSFIGEDFRVYAALHGLRQPHHHNAWGALMMTAAKRGICCPTDQTRQMCTSKSHARRSPVWIAL
jgi:hypothetical protein